jgi:hypothetical protein
MSSQDVLESLDDELLAWRIKGMSGTPAERRKFLKECFPGARFNLRVALLATPFLRPGQSQREMFDELVPTLLENVAQQGRESGYDDEQVRLYVEAHERAYRALAGEFGFSAMSQDEIEALKEF